MESEIDLQNQIRKLTKINRALMARVERSMDLQGNSYSLFTTAIGLESQNRARTDELKAALERLERSNEALMIARDTAEEAAKIKTRFFTAVGHDVLQPLNAARLSLSALEESNEIHEHQKLAIQIDHALNSIEELLRTIIDISKLEAGVTQAVVKNIHLDDIFASLITDFTPLIQNKGLTLHTNLPSDLAVRSDAALLRRILQNLLTNAVRYTSEGHIKIGAERDGSQVRIYVEDTGPGIPIVDRQRIFEEFQRGSATDGQRRDGFGLGLSIVKRMINALEHSIDMDSKTHVGTTFTIIAPAAETADRDVRSQPRVARAGAQYDFENTHILVIENDERVQEAMQLVLNRWSCKASLVKNLAGLKDLCRDDNFRPEIILADFHLDHDERGIEGVRFLREHLGKRIPAIVITADHERRTADVVKEAACELLHKPVRPAELRALIQHLLNQET